MKISAKAAYACIALIDLAIHRDKSDPVRVAEVAKRNEIPERFLVQILLQLKGAGYVQSTRGASGGYHLVVDPAKLSLWDVIQLVDGPTALGTMDDIDRKGATWQVLHGVWNEVNQHEEALLKQTTFRELLERVGQQNADMYYI